jgi:putative methylase
MRSKKELAVTLSKLLVFEKASLRLEQYPTDSEVAAEILWWADQAGEIENKEVADLGCGTGILGIGALLMGAKFVHFVDVDKYALKRLKENLQLFEIDNYEIYEMDVSQFNKKVDIVIQNPPFGTKTEHADKLFLESAFKVTDMIYSFHKTNTDKFVTAIAKDHGFKVSHFFKFNFPIKQTQEFHKVKIKRIDVGCWRIEKVN